MTALLYAQQQDNLDAIAYRTFGQTAGIVEQLLTLNPQLANQPILPLGTPVRLPNQRDIRQRADKHLIQLWD